MLDLILITFVAISGFISYNKGLAMTLYKFISVIASYVVAIIFYPIVANMIKLSDLDERLSEWIKTFILNIDSASGIQTQSTLIKSQLGFLPEPLLDIVIKNNNKEVYKLFDVTNVVDYSSQFLSEMIVNALAFFLIWVVVRMGLMLFKGGLSFFTSLPVIKTIDRTGGLVLGIAQSIILIWIFCMIIPLLLENPSFVGFNEGFESSILTKWFYNNNLLLNYIATIP
ncbi:MAG: hypothetical protein BEN19_04315 [Epulopiscium sp. Nuni2H_MBin003]|nr:MAG: hypothetical protein BEN19_04315 [Epulopiscium sp. Nuni2H_MBin003]